MMFGYFKFSFHCILNENLKYFVCLTCGMSSKLFWSACLLLPVIFMFQSWRSFERFSNSNIPAPTGTNKGRQATNAMKTLMKIFGGQESDLFDFVMKQRDQTYMNDTLILNTVMENLSNLSMKLIHPVTKFLILKSNQS